MFYNLQKKLNTVYGKNYFDQPIKTNMKTCLALKKLKQVKEMIAQLVVCWTIVISKTIMVAIALTKLETLDANPKAT